MATKKQVLAKKGKATTKPTVKKVAKVVPKKAVSAKPIKKETTKKVASKPAPKKVVAAKPVKKVAQKPLPVKKAAKPNVKQAVINKSFSKSKVAVPQKSVVAKPLNKAVKTVTKAMAKKEVKKVLPAKEVDKAKKVVASADVKPKDIKVPAPKPVVVPKISTKTARKYEPDFTKSVLDKIEVKSDGPTMRYSDGELVEFRELIQRKLEAAKKELTYLQGLITRKDDMGGDEGDNRYMTMEDGSLSMEREQLSQMASRQITFIDHLEKALMRIENKTYGICRVTGRLIDKARLRAVPHATLSIEAKMGSAR
jgi:RNA polymerase-binding transcription factor DksA